MIICMTLHDNDFTEMIEDFAETFLAEAFFNKSDMNFKIDERVRLFLSPSMKIDIASINCEEWENDKTLIQTEIINAWGKFVDKLCMAVNDSSEDCNDTLKYLKENFCVCVQMSYIDKWENGESVYYFTSNRMCITQ